MNSKFFIILMPLMLLSLNLEAEVSSEAHHSSSKPSACQFQKINSEPLEEAEPFFEDFARVKINGKWGTMDTNGEWVIPAKFDFIYPFSGKEITPARLKYEEGFIDRKGEWIIEPEFSAVGHFSEGLAEVRRNGKWGYITEKGRFLFHLRTKFDGAGSFIDGIAPVLLNGKQGYVNRYGEYEVEPKFTSLGYFSEGLAQAAVSPDYEPIGYIDTDGDFEIRPRFERARDFHNGMARVMFDGKWAYIDTDGDWLIPPTKFEYVGYFDEEDEMAPAPAKFNGKWGYIDTKGEWIIHPQFDKAESFSGGFAAVDAGEGKSSYINLKGERISELTFDYAFPFNPAGFATVQVDDKMGLIDTEGKWLIEPKFSWIGPIFERLGSATFDNEGLFLVKIVCSEN